jgi:hypothetical protein
LTLPGDLGLLKRQPNIAQKLALFGDDDVFSAIREAKGGTGEEKPVKQAELEALLAHPRALATTCRRSELSRPQTARPRLAAI